jgi:polyisoprenoid-binding protein YceI
MMFRKIFIILHIAALLLVSACSQPPSNTGGNAAGVPQHKHAQVYRLDSQQSSIIMKVYKDGPLARFGHNHVIAVGSLSGTVYREKELTHSEFELTIPAIQLLVDRVADRAAAGADFTGELTPFAVAGTRENMLGPKLLAAEQYPDIKIESVAVKGELPDVVFTVKITVRGIENQLLLPARLTLADNILVADGHFVLSQAQLGLNPYSVLGGGLRVRDTIDVDYHLQATRDAAGTVDVNGKK